MSDYPIEIIGPTGAVFKPQGVAVKEGFTKKITKISILQGQDQQGKTEPKKMFVDLMDLTIDLAIDGYLSDGDIEGMTVMEIKNEILRWMESPSLCYVNYRGVENFRSEGGLKWIIENFVTDDDDTQWYPNEKIGDNPQIVSNVFKMKFNMKLVLGILSQDYYS